MTAWCRLPVDCIFSSDIRLTFGQTPQLSCLLGSSHPNKRWFSWQGAAYCALWDERTVQVWKIILPNPLCVALPSFIAQGFLSLTGVGFLVFLLENVPFLRETYKMGNECFFFFFEIATHIFGLAIFLNWKQVYVPPILRNCVVSRPFRHDIGSPFKTIILSTFSVLAPQNWLQSRPLAASFSQNFHRKSALCL